MESWLLGCFGLEAAGSSAPYAVIMQAHGTPRSFSKARLETLNLHEKVHHFTGASFHGFGMITGTRHQNL